jgi:hypothetical protein
MRAPFDLSAANDAALSRCGYGVDAAVNFQSFMRDSESEAGALIFGNAVFLFELHDLG